MLSTHQKVVGHVPLGPTMVTPDLVCKGVVAQLQNKKNIWKIPILLKQEAFNPIYHVRCWSSTPRFATAGRGHFEL